MTLLSKAAGMGYRDRDAYRTEAALNDLRDRDDFRALMMDLAMPSDPFAAGGRPARAEGVSAHEGTVAILPTNGYRPQRGVRLSIIDKQVWCVGHRRMALA